MSAAVEVRDLSVTAADGTALLSSIDLRIDPGEQVLLVGPSGSGKSTLLRVLAGLEVAPGGTVTGSVVVAGRQVIGRDLDADPPPLDVGWLPQDPAAAVCLPVVEDDVAFGCENRCWDVPRIESAVRAALAAADVDELRRRDSGTLSAGQGQRVGLAGAIAPSPSLLLLDEPTALLDPVALRGIRDVVASLTTRADPPALLLIEHRLDEWSDGGDLPDRVVALDGGRVIDDGPPEAVWRRVGPALAAAGCHLPWPVERAVGATGPQVQGGERGGIGGPVLVATGLAVGREAPVLRGIDLRVRAGEVVAVVGANGSGKTTLLLTLAGLLRPRAGRVAWPGGRPGLAFGDPELQLQASTVGEEIGLDGTDVDVVLAELGMADAVERSVHRLSGGEQRRLTLATVIGGDRPVLLADEPTRSLDRAGVVWAGRALRRAAAAGRAVVVTSHDLRFVLEVADRVLMIRDGALVAGGSPQQVLAELSGVLPLPAAVRDALGVGA